MNMIIRKSFAVLAIAAFAITVSACHTIHGAGEDVETVAKKVQKEADQHTGDDDNEDNRAHDLP